MDSLTDFSSPEDFQFDFEVPFEGFPPFSEPIGFGTDPLKMNTDFTTTSVPATITPQALELSVPHDTGLHQSLNSPVVLDQDTGKFVPAPSQLILKPCMSIPVDPALTAPQSTLSPSLHQSNPLAFPIETSTNNSGLNLKKRKAIRDADSPVYSDSYPEPPSASSQPFPAKRQKLSSQSQKLPERDGDNLELENQLLRRTVARSAIKALTAKQRYWMKKEKEALADAMECKKKETEAHDRANFYRNRRFETQEVEQSP